MRPTGRNQVVLATALMGCALVGGLRADWRAPHYVATQQGNAQFGMELVFDAAGTLHAFWEIQPDGGFGDANLLHAVQSETGEWETPEVLWFSEENSLFLEAAATPDGRVHAVWRETLSPGFEIFYAEWNRGVWSQPENLSNSLESSNSPQIESDADGTLYVSWVENPNFQLKFTERPPGGSWTEPVFVSQGERNVDEWSLIVAPNALELLFMTREPGEQTELYSSEQQANGTWSPQVQLTDTGNETRELDTTVGPDGTKYIVFRNGKVFNEGQIIYLERPPGEDWGSLFFLNEVENDSQEPNLLLDSAGTVHVTFGVVVDSFRRIGHRNLSQGGNWSELETLPSPPDAERATQPRLALVDEVLHLIWWEFEEDSTFYQSVRTDGQWSTPENMLAEVFDGGGFDLEVSADGVLHLGYLARDENRAFLRPIHLSNDGPAPISPSLEGFLQDGLSGRVGSFETLGARFSDPNGALDLSRVLLDVSSSQPGGSDSLVASLNVGTYELVLLDEDGQVVGPCVPGEETAQLSTASATLDCEASDIAFDRNRLEVEFAVRFDSCLPGGCGTYVVTLAALDHSGAVAGPEVGGEWTLEP